MIMILSPKQAKSLNMNNTIDLKYIIARDYCDSVELWNTKDKVINYGYIVLHYLGMFTLAFIVSFALFFLLYTKSNASYIPDEYKYYWVDNEQDYQRKLRLETCQRVYEQNKNFVDETFIHTTQNPVVRCATMMTLIWAYESDYFQSNMCKTQNNCFWIKSFTTWQFKSYNNRYENYLDFARLYLVWNWNNTFKWHKNRNITQFVYTWSMTDRETYIDFLNKRFWNTYKEIKNIY